MVVALTAEASPTQQRSNVHFPIQKSSSNLFKALPFFMVHFFCSESAIMCKLYRCFPKVSLSEVNKVLPVGAVLCSAFQKDVPAQVVQAKEKNPQETKNSGLICSNIAFQRHTQVLCNSASFDVMIKLS